MHDDLRHRLAILTLALALAGIVPAEGAAAIGTDTTIVLRPHCLTGYEDDNNVLATGGDPEQIRCPSFSVEDPQTLRTPDLRVGDILDIDIIVENPANEELSRIRGWLAYDPHMLKGDQISMSEELPVVTPGESDFSPTEGYVKIEASAEDEGPNDLQVFVARVQFTVMKTTPGGTAINFFDVQRGGHTTVVTGTGDGQEHLLTREPGALHVVFADGKTTSSSMRSVSQTQAAIASSADSAPTGTAILLNDGDVCITDAQCRSSRCITGICQGASPLAGGSACGLDSQCASGRCVNNSCLAVSSESTSSLALQNGLASVGGACINDAACQSGLCITGICIPSLDAQRRQNSSTVPGALAPTAADHSAFALLQIQNLRVTTEGSSVYLGWERLHSSQLKAYNIYYGTTTGRYIQRKTVDATVKNLAIRSLPVGTTYYFAVRAVNLGDQESAFSQEVAITVGDPQTSTAPLAAGSIPDDAGPGKNPVQASVTRKGGSVPGETGIPSTMATLIILSAVIGTAFASRRQVIAASNALQA